MLIQQVIETFKQHGRYKERPRFEKQELDFWETTLGVPLPSSYRTALKAGSFDTNNFDFVIPPYRLPNKKGLVVFAKWNENLFAFDTVETGETGDYRVILLSGGYAPEPAYSNFKEWFSMVIDACIAPNNVE